VKLPPPEEFTNDSEGEILILLPPEQAVACATPWPYSTDCPLLRDMFAAKVVFKRRNVTETAMMVALARNLLFLNPGRGEVK